MHNDLLKTTKERVSGFDVKGRGSFMGNTAFFLDDTLKVPPGFKTLPRDLRGRKAVEVGGGKHDLSLFSTAVNT